MSRRVTEITDENETGFGFFAVEGVQGYFTEEVAQRLSEQVDKEGASAERAASQVAVVDGDSTSCPSCGHRFKVASKPREEPSQFRVLSAAEAKDFVEAQKAAEGAPLNTGNS